MEDHAEPARETAWARMRFNLGAQQELYALLSNKRLRAGQENVDSPQAAQFVH
jgi:hypothetical protein